jgi:hypothetical protein
MLKAIESEQEWVIKRRIVLALGRSSSPDAVPVLKHWPGTPRSSSMWLQPKPWLQILWQKALDEGRL